jgi:mono/diheme cytochrome c family protein
MLRLNQEAFLHTSWMLLLSISFVLSGCVHEPFEQDPIVPADTITECNADSVYFNKDVQPLLQATCVTGCHDAQNANDGVVLTSYDLIMSTARVEAGDPGSSELYEVLIEDDLDKRMPYGQPALSEDQIALIRKWIEQGAQNNSCLVEEDTTTACGAGTISFASDVQPILQNNGCVGCHSSGQPTLNAHPGFKAAVESGRLVGAIKHEAGFKPMPQGGSKIDSCSIATLEAWISQGMLDN